jgi:hypothetical protein
MSKPTRDRTYLAWIRTQPCAVTDCKRYRIEAHHAGPRGMSQKADDHSAIPLCFKHHDELHRLGKRTFCDRYDLDIRQLIESLQKSAVA